MRRRGEYQVNKYQTAFFKLKKSTYFRKKWWIYFIPNIGYTVLPSSYQFVDALPVEALVLHWAIFWLLRKNQAHVLLMQISGHQKELSLVSRAVGVGYSSEMVSPIGSNVCGGVIVLKNDPFVPNVPFLSLFKQCKFQIGFRNS